MTFEAYLFSKKINQQAFKLTEPEKFSEWEEEYKQMHPNSFTMQKLHLINTIRRKFHLNDQPKSFPSLMD